MALIAGTAGNDTLTGGPDDDEILGREGDDRLDGGRGADAIDGGAGDDRIYASRGDDVLRGGAGYDMLSFERVVAAEIDLGRGTASYAGGSARFTGFEVLVGSESDDRIRGSAGTDYVTGIAGDDRISGRDGDDVLAGGVGDDRLRGGAGDDRMAPGPGRDQVDGGPGDDRILLGGDPGTVRIDGGAGRDQIRITSAEAHDVRLDLGRLAFTGGQGTIVAVEDVLGGDGDDTLHGDAGGNRLAGGAGQDVLEGGEGDDRLWGGPGSDVMLGGAGADRFLFRALEDSSDDLGIADRIDDFRADHGDRIVLSAIDADLGQDGDQAFRFVGTAPFQATGELRWFQQGGDTVVQINSSGGLGAELTIRLSGLLVLTASDLVL